MISRFFDNKVLLSIQIAHKGKVQDPVFLLDTGFSGDLLITPEIARELELESDAVSDVVIVNGEKITMESGSLLASMSYKIKEMEVLISKGIPLIGMGFFNKFKSEIIIDCDKKIVNID